MKLCRHVKPKNCFPSKNFHGTVKGFVKGTGLDVAHVWPIYACLGTSCPKGQTIKFLRGGLSKYQKTIRAQKKYGEKISCTNKQIKKKSSKLFKVTVVKLMIYWRKYFCIIK